jgi:hypothetical protein
MQTSLVAGETLNYRVSVADYSAAAGWALTLYLNPRAGGTNLSVASTADGTDHLLQVAAAATVSWAAGSYAWEIWASLGGERYRIQAGQLDVRASLIGASAGLDTRSAAELALAAVTAMLTGRAGDGVQRYKINDRELWRYPLPDLIKLEAKLKAEVAAERRAAGLADGTGTVRRILVRTP